MIKTTIGTVNCAACGNYRPHFTKITEIWQDRSLIRKSSIILRSRKTLFILLHPLLFNPASQNFLYRLCGWRFLRWRQLAHSLLTQGLVSALSIIADISPLHRLEFGLFSWNFLLRGQIRRQLTFDTHENLKTKNKNTTMIRTPANFFRKCEKFAKDSGICRERKDWNTGIQQKKDGICVVLIWKRPRIGSPFFFVAFHRSYYPSELE